MKILFLCKTNERFKDKSGKDYSSGLVVSCGYVANEIDKVGIHETFISRVNSVDGAIGAIKLRDPDIVIVEALWITGQDMNSLQHRFHRTKFAVHLHSNIPFLACESMALTYLASYKNVDIITNSIESKDAYSVFYKNGNVHYCPNIYRTEFKLKELVESDVLNVGCFGAIRPMKNHLTQAIAAIEFARDKNKKLKFFINTSRIEMGANGVLNNLVSLFGMAGDGFDLVPVGWVHPNEFGEFISGMDISMQVSMTETFNIVTADAISQGVPIAVSDKIDWVDRLSQVKSNDIFEMCGVMDIAYMNKELTKINQGKLIEYSDEASKIWHEQIPIIGGL